jgi:hypothetical protein
VMDRRARIYVAWRGRDDDLRESSRRLAAFVASLGAVHPPLLGLRYAGPGGKEETAAGVEGCQSALEAHRVPWATGPTKRVAYQPRLFLERRAAPPVEVLLTCGIERLDLGPIYTPNRLDLRVRLDAGEELTSPAALEAAMRAAIDAFEPDWGFAGAEGCPNPPVAVFSDGVPAVGWMTFLSSRYPEIPAALPRPAVAHVIPRRGTLVVAHPDRFDERDATHLSAMEKVREALEAAGVLVPAAALDRS